MPEDLYQTLGVSRQSDKDEIQKAYRNLARKYHPDMNQNDEKSREKFKRVQEAYDVLSDPEKRAAYDRYGADFEKVRSSGFNPAAGAGGASFEGLDLEQIFGGARGGGGFQNGFSDFFEQLMGAGATGGGGGRSAGRRPRPAAPAVGDNIRHELHIPLKKALTGGQHEFYLPADAGRQKIAFSVPAGIESGSKMRLRGKGYASPSGGPAGDLILVIHVDEHPLIRRQGKNLVITLPVTLKEATLGAKVEVPTPKGTLMMTVPPGSSGGRRLRLKGQGVDDGKGPAGDILIELQIALPEKIDDAARQWIEQFDSTHPLTPRSQLGW
jgi:curved DNA-binding protein